MQFIKMLRKIILRLIVVMIVATILLLAIAHRSDSAVSISSGNSVSDPQCESGKRTEFLLLDAIISVITITSKQ
jgi:hypothetical protein